ncbi:nuclear transport factor 2 family protein [Solwaraspora sp. WMMA2101]|uniref:nuclear transport factor 2 family protein n=1 Tax=Solwaraspora sp. WMMA2101 TaxID=3404124 RepID=UPI003B93FBDB
MRFQTVRVALPAFVVLVLPISGCTTDAPAPQTPTPSAAQTPTGQGESEAVVHAYLDAMRSKDVAQGRAQFCPATQPIFEASATGPNGDFAEEFTVPQAEIAGTRQTTVGYEVTTRVTVVTGGTTVPVELVFTVTPADDGTWCIHDETSRAADPDVPQTGTDDPPVDPDDPPVDSDDPADDVGTVFDDAVGAPPAGDLTAPAGDPGAPTAD